jgi:hypothetical protein
MDDHVFDRLTRMVSTSGSRRAAIGALLAATLLFSLPDASAKRRNHRKEKNGKAKAQAEPCWRAGACILKKGANVSQCNLAGYTAPPSLNCTGCNISRANLSRANLSGVNFTRANLSGSCLVDANFTGAIFANNTNLYNALFCRTKMPDGSVNNSGCDSETACCSTAPCVPTTCEAQGVACGPIPDGCGNTLQCGTCTGAFTTCLAGECTCSAGEPCGGFCVASSCGAGVERIGCNCPCPFTPQGCIPGAVCSTDPNNQCLTPPGWESCNGGTGSERRLGPNCPAGQALDQDTCLCA